MLKILLRAGAVGLFLGVAGARAEEPAALLSQLRAPIAASHPLGVAPDADPGGKLTLLRRFQASMGPWLERRLQDVAHLSVDQWPEHLQRDFDHGLAWKPNNSAPFGALRFSVAAAEGAWCLVKLETSIPGGQDTQVYAFRRNEDAWSLVWQDDWDLEQNLARGRWGLDCRTMRIQDGKALLIAFFHLSPWCEPTTTPSTWRSGVMRIFRIAPDGLASKLHESRQDVWIGGDSMPSLGRMGHQNFTLKCQVESMDVTRHNRARTWLFPYRDGKVYKGIPVPPSPEDCVEEWAALPWKEARRLQIHPELSGAESLHGSDLAENCSEILSHSRNQADPAYAAWNPRQKTWAVRVLSGGRKVLFQVVNTFKGFRILAVQCPVSPQSSRLTKVNPRPPV